MNYIYGYLMLSTLILGYLQYSSNFFVEIKEDETMQEMVAYLGENLSYLLIGIVMLTITPLVWLVVIWNSK